jgi:SAM-dependent methyltransferase
MKMDNCPVCASAFSSENIKSVAYPALPANNSQAKIPKVIRFCGHCGAGMAFPPLPASEIDALYTRGEYWRQEGTEPSSRIFPVPFGLARARWKIIEKFLVQSGTVNGIRLLDIGAGQGYIGLMASTSRRIATAEYTAVEADPAMRQYLQKLWQARKYKPALSTLPSLGQATGDYEVVVLSHLLEHVGDPLSLLSSAVARLSPGGILFVDVPNQDYLFKKDVFPHLLFFSPSSLRFLLERESLEIISIGVWGRNMFKSPLYFKAPGGMKLIGEIVSRPGFLLPVSFLERFYAWYFGVNSMNDRGTWVRAVCRRK